MDYTSNIEVEVYAVQLPTYMYDLIARNTDKFITSCSKELRFYIL